MYGMKVPSRCMATGVMSTLMQTSASPVLQTLLPSHEKTHTRTPEKLGLLGSIHEAWFSPALSRYDFAAAAADSIEQGVVSRQFLAFRGVEIVIFAAACAAFASTW